MSARRQRPPTPHRGGWVRGCAVAWLATTLLSGCTGGAPRLARIIEPAGLPRVVELADTPFYPQADRQCGPAAVATLLGATGHATAPETLEDELFLPGRAGSLQPEVVAAIRVRGLLPYELGSDPVEIVAELAAGRPVLVLQKQGLGPWPAWHYAVVVGYDVASDRVTLRSGTTRRLRLQAEIFDASWARANRWALVALPPGTLPARPDLTRYLQAAAGLEATGRPEAAGVAYAAAVRQWPDEALPRLAVANTEAARGDWSAAERGYAAALERQPGLAAAINNRAEALARLGCPRAALRQLDAGAARVPPDDPLRPTLARTAIAITAQLASAPGDDPSACVAYADR